MCRFWGKTDPGFETVAGELSVFVHQNIVQAEGNLDSSCPGILHMPLELMPHTQLKFIRSKRE